jgi:hypothetical protein
MPWIWTLAFGHHEDRTAYTRLQADARGGDGGSPGVAAGDGYCLRGTIRRFDERRNYGIRVPIAATIKCETISQDGRSVKSLTHLFQFAPLKSGMATSIWRQEGYMAPKPKALRFVFTVGIVLAMALTILTVVTWAAPSSSPMYHPQLLLLY